MRKLAISLTAALVVAAAAVPAAASADTHAGQAPPLSDTALRPTAIEYGLIAGLLSHEPGSDPAVGPGVLDPDDDPVIDPGFGGGSLDPLPTGGPSLSGISARGVD